MIAPFGSQRIRPGADRLADGEQLQLLAEHAVIAALGLFELLQVGVEFGLIEERGRVQPLQLLAIGVPFPIRAGDREQLERPADMAGAGNVLAPAKIDELALPIKREMLFRRQGRSRCARL